MLDINLFREERGNNPELIREFQRPLYLSAELLDEIIAHKKEWHELIRESQPRLYFSAELLDEMIAHKKEWHESDFPLRNSRKDFNKINKEVARLKIDATEMIKNTEENKQLTAKKEIEVQDAYTGKETNLVHDSVPVSNDEIILWTGKDIHRSHF